MDRVGVWRDRRIPQPLVQAQAGRAKWQTRGGRPPSSADGAHAVERGWLVLEAEFRAVWPSELMDVRIDPIDDGWLLDGRFELDLDGPGPADATPARIEGQFSRLYCLDLERLKAATAGPASTSP